MRHLKKSIATGAAALSMALTAVSLAAQPKEGHGARVVRGKDNRVSLRDLEDPSACFWLSGIDFKNRETPYFDKVMASLEATHWYFSASLRSEMERIEVCLTEGRFENIPDDEREKITVFELETEVVAIRRGDKVYVAGATFAEMQKDAARGYMFVHELLHGFIPFNIPRRDTTVISMTKAIRINEETPLTQRAMGLQIKNNYVDLIQTVQGLESYRTNVSTLLNPEISQDLRYGAAYSLRKTEICKYRIDGPFMREIDCELMRKFTGEFIDNFFLAISTGDLTVVKRGLELGFDVNHKLSKKTTRLVRGDIPTEVTRTSYSTPFIRSIPHGNPSLTSPEIFRFLLAHPRIDKNLLNPIKNLVSYTDPKLLADLISDPMVEVNLMHSDEKSTLLHAIIDGTAEHVKVLRSRPDLDVNVGQIEKNNYGRSCIVSPLYYSIWELRLKKQDALEKVKLLLTSPTLDPLRGRSEGCVEILGFFQIAASAKSAETPEQLAIRMERWDVVKMIQDSKAQLM